MLLIGLCLTDICVKYCRDKRNKSHDYLISDILCAFDFLNSYTKFNRLSKKLLFYLKSKAEEG